MTTKTKTSKQPTPARELPAIFIRAERAEIDRIKAAARVARQSVNQYAVTSLLAAAKNTLENSR